MKTWSPYIYFIVFALIAGILFVVIGGGVRSAAASSSIRLWSNSALNLFRYTTLISMFCTIVVASMMGKVINRDFQYDISSFFFSTPVSKFSFLFGRFIGTYLVLIFISASIGVAGYATEHLPNVEQSSYGPQVFAAYIWPYIVMVIPNLFFTGALFFCIGALTKKMMPVYTGAVLLVLLYSIGTDWVENLDNLQMAAILDPFGYSAELSITRYWSISEKNLMLLPLTLELLVNRILWCLLGVGALFLTYYRFSFTYQHERVDKVNPLDSPVPSGVISERIPIHKDFSHRFTLKVLLDLVREEVRLIVKSFSFLILILSAVLFVLAMSTEMDRYLGTMSYPLTYAVLELLGRSFELFAIIIIIFFSGEMVWRERELRVEQLLDSSPVPTWVRFLSKVGAAIVIHFLLMFVLLVCCILVQVSQGYYNFEISQYLFNLFVIKTVLFLPFWILGLTIQTILNRKALSHFIMITIFVFTGKIAQFGYDHYLYRLFKSPRLRYSDLNGYGPYLKPFFWFSTYWVTLAIILGTVTCLLWVRGMESGLVTRFSLARRNSGFAARSFLVITLGIFVILGCYIFYNTNILNAYMTQDEIYINQGRYEREYKGYLTHNQPRISDVDCVVEIFPEERHVSASGKYTVINREESPISKILVSFPGHLFSREIMGAGIFKGVAIKELQWDRTVCERKENKNLGVYEFYLERPLTKNEHAVLSFLIDYQSVGFSNGADTTRILKNGTFFDSMLLFPQIGYNSRIEIENNRIRKRYDLPEKPHGDADIDDREALKKVYISDDADRINFNAIVSTSLDQTAITSGELIKEWQSGERRYFHYRTQVPIWNFFSFLSGRYEILHDSWRDVDIEVFYHPNHRYNLDTIRDAVIDSLDYFSGNFGNYPHQTIRIVEYPRYNGFAQSFATTIPFSEAIGFVAHVDPDDEEDLDYPYYITAHEVAHQWWGHQVCPAKVKGASVLTETLARYSADVLLRKRIGEKKFKRYIRLRLDEYLQGRSGESDSESPLYLANENQGYIYYAKGELVMNTLHDYLGVESINDALSNFISDFRSAGPPYPTTEDFLVYLREETPDNMQSLITDLFETITLYQLKTNAVRGKKISPDKYEVTLEIDGEKLRADGQGNETKLPINDLFDVAVFGKEDNELYLQKILIDKGKTTIVAVVGEKPYKAGIDPYYKMIDRIPHDNVTTISWEED